MKKSGIISIFAALLLFVLMVGCSFETQTPQSLHVEVGEIVTLAGELETSDDSVVTVRGNRLAGVSAGEAVITANEKGKIMKYNVKVEANEQGTTHVFDIGETQYPLVKEGTSEYVIVYPANVDDELITQRAPEELQHFFCEATGITLRIVSDDAVRADGNGCYLFIGDTRQAKRAGIAASREVVGQNGYRIVTRDRAVYMVGGGRFGTLYAVYEFLARQFNYEIYAIDEIAIERNVRDKALLDFNVTDVPDFEWRLGAFGEFWFGDIFPSRMRMHRTEDIWIQLGGLPWHNFKATIPPELHQATHPEWFSPDGVQLCLSRDVEGLSDEVVRQMQKYILANPHLSSLTFTQEDVNVWCSCPSCTALKEKYGVHAASNIRFINVVAKKLKAWLDEYHPDREITIVIFAYHQVEDAPALFSAATGKYEPMDETVVLEENVAVMYAPIFAEHYFAFDDPRNVQLTDTMEKWQALTDKIYLWSYATYFVNYLMPYDCINAMQDKYIYAYKNHVTYLFDQNQYNQMVGTDWYKLKEYVSSKLSWDVYADINVLLDEFFENYFKAAQPAMRKYFESYRTWYAYLGEYLGVGGKIGDNLWSARLWPENVLNEWLGYLDEAYAAIAPLKESDPALYETLEGRICLESISIRHLILVLYESSYTAETYKAMYVEFKADCARLGVSNYNEWGALEQLFNRY